MRHHFRTEAFSRYTHKPTVSFEGSNLVENAADDDPNDDRHNKTDVPVGKLIKRLRGT